MTSRLRNAFSQADPRAILLLCLLLVSPGVLAGCGSDATVTRSGSPSEQTKEDTRSAPDTTPDTEDPTADIQQPQDTTADTPGDEDAPSTDTEQPDVDDDAVDDDAVDDDAVDADAVDADAVDPGCADHSDCEQAGASCIEPGGFAGCGSCRNFLVTCSTDADCASGSGSDTMPSFVCERVTPEDCACDTSISICKSACQSNEDCKEDERCNPDGHCGPRPCSTGVADTRACPRNFECRATVCSTEEVSNPCEICQRTLCTEDAECPSGVCVNGACHGELGTCELPRP